MPPNDRSSNWLHHLRADAGFPEDRDEPSENSADIMSLGLFAERRHQLPLLRVGIRQCLTGEQALQVLRLRSVAKRAPPE
jgi:hypothetical protein